MKQLKKLTLAFLYISFAQAIPPVTPYYSIRSQGMNTPRHLVGTTNDIHQYDMTKVYGLLTVTPEYSRSFDADSISECIFGSNITNCNRSINISGSTATNRGTNDWLADYFYLPTDYKSTVQFTPIIDHFLIDFNWYLGLDEWRDGMYLALYMPLVHTRWDLNLKENSIDFGNAGFTEGYFSPNDLALTDQYTTFRQYASGKCIDPIRQSLADKDVTVALQPLKKAKMDCSQRVKTRLADMRLELGWNIVQQENAHFGLKTHLAAPTGNRPRGEYLFEPIAGNGHHWELGAGVTAHTDVWESQDLQKRISLYFDGVVTHMFGARQKRVFDIKDKPFSRYMLALNFKSEISDELQGNGTTPNAQFDNEIAPLANLSCFNVDVSVGVQTDLTAMMNVTVRGFSWDLGYNFWARSCEDVTLRCNEANVLDNQMWGLKGDARVFGYADGGGTLNMNVPVALSATQNNATINGGLNGANQINANIDNPQLATADSGTTELYRAPGIAEQINTSINPIFLTSKNFQTCDVESRGMTSKLFTHLHYSWLERERWVPSLGIGMHVEFNHDKNGCDNKGKRECPRCSVSNWALWLKGGIAFD